MFKATQPGCLFIAASAADARFSHSTAAFIVPGNCAAGGEVSPCKAHIFPSNERAGIIMTNLSEMAIGLCQFPSILPITAGLCTNQTKTSSFPIIGEHWHGNRRAMPPGGPAVLLRDSIKRRPRRLRGFSAPICHFDVYQNSLFQTETPH